VATPEGGATRAAVWGHVRRLRRPVVNNPKGQTTPRPPDLAARPICEPAPFWTWSLVYRADEQRPAVRAVVEALTHPVGPLGLDDPGVWLPADDPYASSRSPSVAR
jgi:hypothetical protein